jgi:hypothetical protein
MKKLTIGFSLLFLCVFSAMVIYVALSQDFIVPITLNAQEGISKDNPVWNKTIDDLAAYLEAEGLIDAGKYEELSAGIATVARKYSGIDLYWWNFEELEKDSDEYKSYISLQKEGYIDLWGSGMLMYLEKHGPFGMDATHYNGDTDQLRKAFLEYCMEENEDK